VPATSIDYRDLLGKPYRIGSRGPLEWDCLGVAYEVQRRCGHEVDELARLDGYDSVPAAWTMLDEWPGMTRWQKVGDRAGAATEVGDVLYCVPTATIHHVLTLVWAQSPRIVLHTNLRRGVHALPISRAIGCVGVYRLKPRSVA
jgi:hypothetical protein